jgi:hypothetical protein
MAISEEDIDDIAKELNIDQNDWIPSEGESSVLGEYEENSKYDFINENELTKENIEVIDVTTDASWLEAYNNE